MYMSNNILDTPEYTYIRLYQYMLEELTLSIYNAGSTRPRKGLLPASVPPPLPLYSPFILPRRTNIFCVYYIE